MSTVLFPCNVLKILKRELEEIKLDCCEGTSHFGNSQMNALTRFSGYYQLLAGRDSDYLIVDTTVFFKDGELNKRVIKFFVQLGNMRPDPLTFQFPRDTFVYVKNGFMLRAGDSSTLLLHLTFTNAWLGDAIHGFTGTITIKNQLNPPVIGSTVFNAIPYGIFQGTYRTRTNNDNFVKIQHNNGNWQIIFSGLGSQFTFRYNYNMQKFTVPIMSGGPPVLTVELLVGGDASFGLALVQLINDIPTFFTTYSTAEESKVPTPVNPDRDVLLLEQLSGYYQIKNNEGQFPFPFVLIQTDQDETGKTTILIAFSVDGNIPEVFEFNQNMTMTFQNRKLTIPRFDIVLHFRGVFDPSDDPATFALSKFNGTIGGSKVRGSSSVNTISLDNIGGVMNPIRSFSNTTQTLDIISEKKIKFNNEVITNFLYTPWTQTLKFPHVVDKKAKFHVVKYVVKFSIDVETQFDKDRGIVCMLFIFNPGDDGKIDFFELFANTNLSGDDEKIEFV